MAREDIFAAVLQTPATQALRQRVESGGSLSLAGIHSPGQPFLAALLRRLFPQRTLVVVTNGIKAQEIFQQDLETWLKQDGAARTATLFYPAWEVFPHEEKLPHADVISDRLETLLALTPSSDPSKKLGVCVVTQIAAMMQRTFSPDGIRDRVRHITRRAIVEPQELMKWLSAHGYEVESQVTQKGEAALRGGILDVFPLNSPWPVRFEFFGDEIESIRLFDPATQLSREEIREATLAPGGELGMLRHLVTAAAAAVNAPPHPALSPNGGEGALSTILDHLPPDSILLLLEPEELKEHAAEYAQQIPANDPFFVDWDELLAQANRRGLTTIAVREATTVEAAIGEVAFPFSSLEQFRPIGTSVPDQQIADTQRRQFFAQLHRWLRQGYEVEVFCNNEGERHRFLEIWTEHAPAVEAVPPPSSTLNPQPSTHLGSLSGGFLFEPARRVVVTDAEIFGRYKIQRPRRLKSAQAVAARSGLQINFADLEEGDYVVHLEHGIGRYAGLGAMPAGAGRRTDSGAAASSDETQECLIIEYGASQPDQPAPRLYVPVSQSHLVGKYVGAGKARPPLSTLGGTRWGKIKAQAEAAVRDLAGDLLELQAARAAQPGYAFATDAPWQRDFESAFLYEETTDQLRAIAETKHDMESAKPMDRLICGDVGYGKTEVAIRAAFKSVMNGKQVAILVPTTILAEQHFHTFRERVADYPIRVEQLSRFLTKSAQQRILRDCANGSVDIVIGTHRLVQDDVAFKDLGLVVIDEEQRFGVLHKEKLKLIRRLVDVLTLSATPIPRTLHLALMGARDMSTIETPPQDRLPIETIIAQYDERLIRDAVQRELNRQGQVFFLHNRVADIDSLAGRVQALVPSARIVIGHGQMEADQLEQVMTRFIQGEADILVCTSIIESGIDIPNANTIIINRADRFGLSDLYQLRGRVGRYKHQAYAYLLLPRHAALLSDVRKRIGAIRQYSSLGSGFKIAMRDLEIRGAGNLLGAQQSGHIAAVGFELYCQLLKQSVSALRGEKVKPRVEVEVRIDFLSPEGDSPEGTAAQTRSIACFPVRYIDEPRQRIEMYRKLAEVDDKESLSQLRAELLDRFGKVPAAAELLLELAELKFLASQRGITTIEVKEGKAMFMRGGEWLTLGGKFPRLTKKSPRAKLLELRKLLPNPA